MSRTVLFTPVAILGLGVLLISGIREQYTVPAKAPIATLRTDFAGVPSHDLEVPEEERKVAGMTDYVMRVFGSDTMPAFTAYVGYYDKQVQGKSIHSPKNCLPGAGWEIMESARLPLAGGAPGQTVNRVLLANKGVRALVYYWYQGRGRIEASEYKVKWNLMRDAALTGRTEEALVRIVMPIANNVPITPEDDARAMRWSVQLSKAVNEVMP
ncbi:MAG: EpsI family protein [Gemmatimonadetes bacterium]|nr:EpsI family protein [Gemmatimonadota bacterium]